MFIKNPNIPDKKVNSVLIDYRADKAKKALEEIGITVYQTPAANIAYSAISGHPDIAFHHLDENSAVASPEVYEYYCKLFGKKHIIKGTSSIKSTYPEDIAYNAARVGNAVFLNEKFTDNSIIDYYIKKGIKLINVKQGYSKCSICIISENAIITEDTSIAKAAKKNEIDVLKINSGYIHLKNFPYGFIGGASGLIADNTVAFCGNIQLHPNYKDILNFCENHKVKICSLYDNEIEDIGSIIPIS